MNLKYQVSSIYPLLILVYHGISWTYHHFHSRRNHFPGGHPYSTTPRPGLWVLLVSEKSVSLVAMNHGDMSLRYTAYTYSYNLLYIYILYYIYSTYPAKEKISILGCPFFKTIFQHSTLLRKTAASPTSSSPAATPQPWPGSCQRISWPPPARMDIVPAQQWYRSDQIFTARSSGGWNSATCGGILSFYNIYSYRYIYIIYIYIILYFDIQLEQIPLFASLWQKTMADTRSPRRLSLDWKTKAVCAAEDETETWFIMIYSWFQLVNKF